MATESTALSRFGNTAPALVRAGFAVLPVVPHEKRPALPRWSEPLSVEQVDALAASSQADSGTGLLSKRFPGLDIDIRDHACAEVIQAAAEKHFGPAPVRIGAAPKRLLMYRTDDPFRKVKVFLQAPDGTQHAIEFLGDGQQYVINGRHPSGVDYTWPNGDGPGNTDVWDLTAITLAQVNAFIQQIPQHLLPGWLVVGREASSALSSERHATSERAFDLYREQLEGWDAERVERELLNHIDPDVSYETWVQVGMALRHQFGDAGFEQWQRWSERGSKYKEGECESKWSTFREQRASGHGPVTLASVIKTVNQGRKNFLPGPSTIQAGCQHPLLNFTPIDGPLEAPAFVIPGFITEGVLTIAGSPGVGKTTAMVPLALTAAGIHAKGDPLAPKHWRHVVYISEDVNQAKRILLGVMLHSGIDAPQELVAERFHLVSAHRMPIEDLVLVGVPYRERFTRVVDGVEVPPLIVIDTKSAVIASEEENSNSEASKAIALLKQQFANLPVWIIGHVAKTDANRTNAKTLSMRGGGAIEGDANQTAFLVNESGERFLVLGKIRFEARWPELQIETHTAETVARDQWGDLESVTLRWGRVTPPEVSRSVLKAQAKQAADETELRARVLEFVRSAAGTINRNAIYLGVRAQRTAVKSAVDALLASGELIEQAVPRGERHNNNQKRHIVLGALARSTVEEAS